MVEKLCGRELSKSSISELCKKLDPIVKTWNGRDLREKEYSFLLVDALAIKVRKGGRVNLQSVLVAYGVNRVSGVQSILGAMELIAAHP